jgi:hypothetical protein
MTLKRDWLGDRPLPFVGRKQFARRYAVAIVVDPAFEHLFEVADTMAVWVANTPFNRSLADHQRRERPHRTPADGVTVFNVVLAHSPEDWCAHVLPKVELHHGCYSHNPPYSVVEVFGVPLTERLRAAFAEFEFTHFQEQTDGFTATTFELPEVVERQPEIL